MDGKSLDLTREKLEQLKSLLPEVFVEDKLDWEKLRATLKESHFTEFSDERYVLNWAGKSEAFLKLQEPSSATLIPCKEESVNFDKTEHLFIEGENLEVLKALQRSYFGKVKMIYIDPPYNTGNDFIYNDKFAEDQEGYLQRIGEKDGKGFKINGKLIRNTKEGGHFHSNWLSMIYPRLYLARNLLREDGVIFVSIDDNEVHNLRLVMNEIFGEENFVGDFIWVRKKKGAFLNKKIRKMTEYVLSYQKAENEIEFFGEKAYSDKWQPIVKRTNLKKELKFPANKVVTTLDDGEYLKGKFNDGQTSVEFLSDFSVKEGLIVSEFLTRARYVWTQDFFDKELRDGSQVMLSKKFGFNVLRHDQAEKFKAPSSLVNQKQNVGTNEDATKEISTLFSTDVGETFNYAKPSSLIKYLTKFQTNSNNIILDFFAGSATTAHAVLDLNKEDGGNRKFIMVQMAEPCDKESESYKAGYKTIADIGKERIRRVIQNIKGGDSAKPTPENTNNSQDLGFRAFRLQESNFKKWQTKIKDAHQLAEQLKLHVDPVKKGSKTEDILYELLLKHGIELTAKIKKKGKVYIINDDELALLLESVTPENIEIAIEAKPQKVIALDRLFNGGDRKDQLKTNTHIKMKDAEIEFETV